MILSLNKINNFNINSLIFLKKQEVHINNKLFKWEMNEEIIWHVIIFSIKFINYNFQIAKMK